MPMNGHPLVDHHCCGSQVSILSFELNDNPFKFHKSFCWHHSRENFMYDKDCMRHRPRRYHSVRIQRATKHVTKQCSQISLSKFSSTNRHRARFRWRPRTGAVRLRRATWVVVIDPLARAWFRYGGELLCWTAEDSVAQQPTRERLIIDWCLWRSYFSFSRIRKSGNLIEIVILDGVQSPQRHNEIQR